MNKTIRNVRAAIAVTAIALAGVAHAQLVSNMVAPAQGKVGEPVKVTVNFDVMSGTNCGIFIHWGDGASDTFKINQVGDVPLNAQHTYAKAGSYKIVAEPKRVGTVLKCGGKNQEATVAVAGGAAPVAAAANKASAPTHAMTPPAAASAPKAAAPASVCPDGWKLASPVNKKTQAFTCTAAANTKVPETKVSCPGDLTYFENSKKGQLGCRP